MTDGTQGEKLPKEPPSAGSAPGRKGRPYKFRGEGMGFFQACLWWLGQNVSWVLAILLFRLKARGQMDVPKAGGVLMVANHQSFLDPWLIGIMSRRQVHYMARDTLFKGGFSQWLAESLNAFPVKRGSADLGAIRAAVERLDKGFVVNIFPEGTRSEDGTIGAIAPGVTLILNRAKTPVRVVPVIVDGAFDAWPRNAKLPRPGKVRVVYGKAIEPEEWKEMEAEAMARRIRRELVKLQEEVGSRHAGDSKKRMEAEEAAAPVEAKPRRVRRRGEETKD